jgi:iron-sulfur cluster repair protein YtfE (RIC family)
MEALMEGPQVTTQMKFNCNQLPDFEVPMINTMVTCLGGEHRRLNDLNMQLAFAATRLVGDPGAVAARQRALEVWDEVRHELRSHLQIEEELVFSWGEGHHAISDGLLETLKKERQEMGKLMAALHEFSAGGDREAQTGGDRGDFAQTLLALAMTLDSHVERYDGEVLPSILRTLFHK